MKLLKTLRIVQEVSNRERKPKLGQGYSTAYRLNPYNPLSYLLLVIAFPASIILFGLLGTYRIIVGERNPFKWN